MTVFAKRTSVEQIELGDSLAPRFDADGLMPCIVVEAGSGDVLMLGYMNAEAIGLTLSTGQAHFWSRSRQALWRKGEHSGFEQRVVRLRVDDDQDALLLEVRLEGPGSCHVGFRTCFYREVLASEAADQPPRLARLELEPAFDAAATYAGLDNPTKV